MSKHLSSAAIGSSRNVADSPQNARPASEETPVSPLLASKKYVACA
jgi:hypothetical protein